MMANRVDTLLIKKLFKLVDLYVHLSHPLKLPWLLYMVIKKVLVYVYEEIPKNKYYSTIIIS